MRKRFPGIVFTQRQLRNRRHRLNKKLLTGYKPFQAVMKMLDERNIPYQTKFQDKYLRYQEFDRVTSLKGRPRGSGAFASKPNAPVLTAPPLQAVEEDEAIPATQPTPVPASQPAPPPTPTGDTIVVASPPRARKAVKNVKSSGRQSGLNPSIRRTPSSWEGVTLDGAQDTPGGSSNAAPPSSTASRDRDTTRGGRGKTTATSTKRKASKEGGTAKRTTRTSRKATGQSGASGAASAA
ncbi:hypothetical protein N658DRAFT_212632 [Parathielavia hyrcaniae]|uniref:Uncharacterized protein n=1 Tax=Parathielavia hyrcaniae TaxID=113614 RepID=A0AAN6PVE2_9PEZI|nr:hypothetical protein N658DRAFT_212632 [Parathielavia hyrcaniae]